MPNSGSSEWACESSFDWGIRSRRDEFKRHVHIHVIEEHHLGSCNWLEEHDVTTSMPIAI
jgi:hypothetical protein